jgi:PPM family protein phosphatase
MLRAKKKQDTWRFGLSTNIGPVKKQNEDVGSIRILNLPEGDCLIALVADGMGGYEAGEMASNLASSLLKERIASFLEYNQDLWLDEMQEELKRYFIDINQEIKEEFDKQGMTAGTTLSVLMLYKNGFLVGHIGDSRIYQLKEAVLGSVDQTEPLSDCEQAFIIQLTKDHSWVESEVEKGSLTKDSARLHPKRNVLLQCLGIKSELEPHIITGTYSPEDTFLLASDGFHALFSDDSIHQMIDSQLNEGVPFQQIADNLVNKAFCSNATDNITVILIQSNAEYKKPLFERKLLNGFSKKGRND